MPSLTDIPSPTVKLLAFGDSKTRKTSSLVSLVAAGYKLAIYDFDNMLGSLTRNIHLRCPDLLGNVYRWSTSDKYKPGAIGGKQGMVLDGKPTAWIDSLRMLNHWKTDTEDLGDPSGWGPDWVLVIDSLSRWCDSAYNYHDSATPRTGGKGGEYDGRAIYGSAQDDVEKQIATLVSDRCATNVVVIGHGVYMKLDDGKTRILPQGVGSKLSPKIPTYFPNIVYYKSKDDAPVMQLESDRMVNVANEAFLTGDLPIDTGLATIFAALRGQAAETTPRPTAPSRLAALKRA